MLFCTPSFAEEKSWNAQGDGTGWFDAANWLSEGVPTDQDDTKVDLQGAAVDVPQAFAVRSLTVGGKKESTVSVNNFVAGAFEPQNETDDAVLSRRDGKLILKGSAGKVTLKGAYKDSEEIIPDEPSFMLYVK